MHSACFEVLRSPDLIKDVFQYQNGMFGDLVEIYTTWQKTLRDGGNGIDIDGTVYSSKDLCLLTLQDQQLLVHIPIIQNNVHLLKRVLTWQPSLLSFKALRCGIKYGHLGIVECLLVMIMERNNNMQRYVGQKNMCFIDLAAYYGHLHIIKYFHDIEQSIPHTICTTRAMDFAAEQGHIDVIKYLHSSRHEGCTTQAMDSAAMNGHNDIVIFLHNNRNEGCTVRAMNFAASQGHLDIVQFLHENRNEGCTTHAMNWAARNGHLNMLEFLHSNRSEGCNTNAMDFAAKYGHIQIVKFLQFYRKEGCTSNGFNYALINKHYDVVNFLLRYRPYQAYFSKFYVDIQLGKYPQLEQIHYNIQQPPISKCSSAEAS